MTDLPYTMMKTVDAEELHARIAELEKQNTILILEKEGAETRLLFAKGDSIAEFSLLPQDRRKTGEIVVAWSVIDDASRRLQEQERKIEVLEAQLAAVPQWTRITDDPATRPEKTCLVWLSVVEPWESHLLIWMMDELFRPGVGDWWYSWYITPPQVEP